MRRLVQVATIIFRRNYSAKVNVTTSEEVLRDVENAVYKPRKHPGIIKVNTIKLPDDIVDAFVNVTEDHPIKSIIKDGESMQRHLKGRVPPMEQDQICRLRDEVYKSILSKEMSKETKDSNKSAQQQRVKDKVINILKKKVYNWTPMTYDAYNSLVYLFSRAPAEYAALVKIFTEIKTRDSKFVPRSLFDFGSGVGTGTWAATLFWKDSIYEYFNVDTSSFMNDLAQLILQGGRGTKKMSLKGVYYRQFLPSNNATYDIVISAYSLLELPSFQTRMETVLKLWNKTEKYLVLVEQGTNGGFRAINEARDYILSLKDFKNKGHVFSPCPHEMPCPRFLQDDTPCNFDVSYFTPPIQAIPAACKERYSYIVLKRGEKSEDSHWPRIVRETLVRSKHAVCRMCTADGNLQEVIFTAKKHGKLTYQCARSSKWGNRLPIEISSQEENIEAEAVDDSETIKE